MHLVDEQKAAQAMATEPLARGLPPRRNS